MRFPRIYVDQLLRPGDALQLQGQTYQHLVRVLRLRPGAELVLFNGKGGEYQATLADVQRRGASVTVGGHVDVCRESVLRITLLQAISRGERMDYALQKATELGVDNIRPVIAEHTIVRPGDKRMAGKMDHWRKVIVAASEQSGRTKVPELLEVTSLEQSVRAVSTDARRLVFDSSGSALNSVERVNESLVVLVGPEGGLTESELNSSAANGFTHVQLGPRTLRTETASAAALTAVQLLWGDLNLPE
ncbi:MAG: 16S rRNA (uracil(1498)-N(3))-methyltransferase [Gammaproteobacteria bacterium]